MTKFYTFVEFRDTEEEYLFLPKCLKTDEDCEYHYKVPRCKFKEPCKYKSISKRRQKL